MDLWRGNTLSLAKSGMTTMIQFNSFHHLKTLSKQNQTLRDNKSLLLLVSSGGSAIVTNTLTYPLDQWKTRWMVTLANSSTTHANFSTTHAQASTWNKLQQMSRVFITTVEQRQLYRGFGMSLASALPFGVVNFSLQHQYERRLALLRKETNSILDKHDIQINPSILTKTLAGGLAATTSTALLYPLDTIKKNIQVNQTSTMSTSKLAIQTLEKPSVIATITKLYRESLAQASESKSFVPSQLRIGRFYNGLIPNLAKSFVGYSTRWFAFGQATKKNKKQ
jgi:hypothetical protein